MQAFSEFLYVYWLVLTQSCLISRKSLGSINSLKFVEMQCT